MIKEGMFKIIDISPESAHYERKDASINKVVIGRIKKNHSEEREDYYIIEGKLDGANFYCNSAKVKEVGDLLHKEYIRKAKIIRRLGNKLL